VTTGEAPKVPEARDETHAEAGEGKQNSALSVRPADLTIPADRLAGSSRCLNCGTALQGPFCHYCGQPDRNFMRFFPVLLRELMEDFLDFDSRFMRTMKPAHHETVTVQTRQADPRLSRRPPLSLYPAIEALHFLQYRLFFPGGADGGRLDRNRQP